MDILEFTLLILLVLRRISRFADRAGGGVVIVPRLALAFGVDVRYAKGRRRYHVHRVPLGFALMFVAGVLPGLLSIGSGAKKSVGDGPG